MKKSYQVVQYIFLSIIAAIILLLLVFLSMSNLNTIKINDRLFVSGFFIISCLIGISLTIYPGWIRRKLKHKIFNKSNKYIQKTERRRYGHHPDCNQFKNHTIRIKNKIYCAGCLGLAIGCLISIFFIIIYMINHIKLPSDIFVYLVIFGFIIIGLVLIEIVLNIRNTFIHIISNILLVISFLIIFIGVTEITSNKIYGMMSIILSYLWLDTRIQLSNWNHSKICENCNKSCKMY